MPTEMPDHGDFQVVRDDLRPLVDEFGEGQMFLPDGLESIIEAPMSNGLLNAIPWEYHVTASTVRHRGTPVAQFIVIAGATILQRDSEESDPVCWRFIDWSAVRAQLGVSAGRGELADFQDFVDLNGNSVDR
jgi:hypothetical protein